MRASTRPWLPSRPTCRGPSVEVDALLPYDRGDLVSKIHEHGEVLHLDHTAEGTRVRALVNPSLAGELGDYAVASA